MILKILLMLTVLLHSSSGLAFWGDKSKARRSLMEVCEAGATTSVIAAGKNLNRNVISTWCACTVSLLNWQKATRDDCVAGIPFYEIHKMAKDVEVVSLCGNQP